MGLDRVVVSVDFDDVDGKCDDRSFIAVLNPLPRRSIAALSFQSEKRESEDGSSGAGRQEGRDVQPLSANGVVIVALLQKLGLEKVQQANTRPYQKTLRPYMYGNPQKINRYDICRFEYFQYLFDAILAES